MREIRIILFLPQLLIHSNLQKELKKGTVNFASGRKGYGLVGIKLQLHSKMELSKKLGRLDIVETNEKVIPYKWRSKMSITIKGKNTELEIDIADIIPIGKSGDWEIRHKIVTEQEAAMERIRWALAGKGQYTHSPGRIAMLYNQTLEGNKVMMSDTPMERETNERFLRFARGDILIAGLGLGTIILPLFPQDSVKTITVIEQSQDVFNLVYPHIKKFDTENKLSVEIDNIFNCKTTKKFDTIYFDIWKDWSKELHEEAKTLRHKFLPNLNPGGWIGYCRNVPKGEVKQ